MLHDDIFEYYFSLAGNALRPLELLTEEERDKKFAEHREEFMGTDQMVVGNVYQFLHETILAKPAVFYFDYSHGDENDSLAPAELMQTAREFFLEGVLKMPFDNCIFVMNMPGDHPIVCMLTVGKGDADSVTQMIWQYGFQEGIPPKEMAKKAMVLDAMRFKPTITTDKSEIPLADYVPFKYCDTNKEWIDERINKHASLFSIVLVSLLQMGMPHFTRERIEVPAKLNKKREKNGKIPMAGYTKVFLRPDIQADLNRGSKVSGYTVRPHWRRGHIRTLQSGKKIPVQPCMVNWVGETELEKNTYEVAV